MQKLEEKSEQYTNLLDNHGKEIWEGDIIKTNKGNYPVSFCSGAFRLHKNACDCVEMPQVGETIIKDLEIIGNIHENPDLLK